MKITPALRQQATTWKEDTHLLPAIVGHAGPFRWLAYHSRKSTVIRSNGTRRTMTAMSGVPGYVDLTLFHVDTGAAILSELKQEGKYPTPAQRRWAHPIRLNRGVLYLVWRPLDFLTHQVDAYLSDPDRVIREAAEQADAARQEDHR